MDAKVKETLEKQLQLLSERSLELPHSDREGLAALTNAMCSLANVIPLFQSNRK